MRYRITTNLLDSFLMSIYVFWGLWYVFFNASLVLRPMYNVLWPLLCILGFIWKIKSICQLYKRYCSIQIVWYVFFFVISIITIFYSLKPEASLLYVESNKCYYYFLYHFDGNFSCSVFFS